ncbi:ATP-binding cassette domain-containing protein [Clostridium botulinum]|uniref:ATP-binding cassette domain-containing protein n=1 Tax=Clostridium botulinum TaxID=1491 RepID=UPI002245E086|nr:ATP-binding cassette domain-containing protein [Clostridium botulinum]UZP02619.1 ATP-binding cassette domain-containing protein [Clostridium botulinum]UZP05977.1 ATP-binding cassette domain-containing protein [Clostridium botulinum]UZP09358.1 ATP-binding cassette domain-containing protein [Clostridium botulinum]
MEKITIRDAHENNLKHIDLEIPINSFTCVTGCSGCGKSSLVFDTIYAESQRGFLEGMTGNIYGQKLMNKPKVRIIENLRPALNISQNYYNVNPRSTIGTTTEISYYLRSLFAILNNGKNNEISESIFSSNNPKAFCLHCSGIGIETVVSESLLIPDKEKTLKDGAIVFFKGASESKEQKYLEALCEHYSIDIEKKVSELSKKELFQLLYSEDKIKYKISYKEGKRRKQHYVFLQGAVSAIMERVTQSDNSMSSCVYSKYMEDVPCHVCGGTKLRKEVLDYKINGLNYHEVENMELIALNSWLQGFDYGSVLKSKKELVSQLINSIACKINSLIQLNVGYLCLNRSIPSLSGGERQRIRIATQLTCSLKGLIYILDEPCKGLHYRDITSVIKSTRDLINRGNTVIAIEHNKRYIASADEIIELGPVGGPDGGYIVNTKTKNSDYKYELSFKPVNEFKHFFELKGINFRNIKNQDACLPIGGITCITGISGSGKSTLTSVISKCFERKTSVYCKSFSGANLIKRVIEVNQAPIGKTPRSTIVSYLGIFDEIRTLFSKTTVAKKLKLSASLFSMNVKGGRCECCQGTGLQKIELNYLPSSYITCPECEGRRFNEKILSVIYNGKTIQEVLKKPISEIIDTFSESKKVTSVLNNMVELGLGYLKLGQMSMNLSGGEAQRIKLAKALGVPSKGHNLYILDEPTSGLNDMDIEKFEKTLISLQEKQETLIIVEHNIEFIAKISDHIIDFGTFGGNAGGKITIQGSPETVFSYKESSLYGLEIEKKAVKRPKSLAVKK